MYLPLSRINVEYFGAGGRPGTDGTDGQDGENGLDGTPGPPGADGEPTYVHIAYANSSNGETDFSRTDPAGRTYVGFYVDQTLADSATPGAYAWSLIKGTDGQSAISVTISTNSFVVQADSGGATKPSQLPKVVTLKVLLGSVDITAACSVTLAPTEGISGSYAAPNISITQADASGYIDVTVKHDTLVAGTPRIGVTRQRDAPPPASQTSGGGLINTSISATSYSGPIGGTVILKANGSGQLACSGGGEYYADNFGAGNVTFAASATFAWRSAGGGAWNYPAEASGSNAVSTGGGEPNAGAVSVSQTLSGLTPGGAYEVGLALRKRTGTSGATASFSGQFGVGQ